MSPNVKSTCQLISGKYARRRFSNPLAVYSANSLERIAMARAGLPVSFIKKTATLLRMPQRHLSKILNIPQTSITRRQRIHKPLSLAHSERLIGLIMLVGQVQAIVENTGDVPAGFDTGTWTAAWLNTPLPALRNTAPEEFMDTMEGQRLVADILRQSVYGAYV